MEDALTHIEEVEMKKATAMASIVMAAQMGRFPKDQIQHAAEMTKIKAMDELF